MTSDNDRRFYVDVRRVESYVAADIAAGASGDPRYMTFGPFTSRARAEDCLVALVARLDICDGHVRDPKEWA